MFDCAVSWHYNRTATKIKAKSKPKIQLNLIRGIIRSQTDLTIKEKARMTGELLLTQEGYDKIEAEHDELIAVKRAEISASIKEALAHGIFLKMPSSTPQKTNRPSWRTE